MFMIHKCCCRQASSFSSVQCLDGATSTKWTDGDGTKVMTSGVTTRCSTAASPVVVVAAVSPVEMGRGWYASRACLPRNRTCEARAHPSYRVPVRRDTIDSSVLSFNFIQSSNVMSGARPYFAKCTLDELRYIQHNMPLWSTKGILVGLGQEFEPRR